jgi:hypothetical protein
MKVEPTITIRRIGTPEVLEADIRRRLARLERFYPSIIAAHVLVELAERRHVEGRKWRVRIEVSVPGERIVVTHDASLRPDLRARAVQRTRKQDEPEAAHRYARVAVREGFEATRRQLQDYARRQRGAARVEASRRRPLRQRRPAAM